ncbi:hypothetical protein RhiirB3_407009 [Rhizophagus irregularis]|nr:hypothetical protein RhiirB3_407009 [Rhizophagus irregularis]
MKFALELFLVLTLVFFSTNFVSIPIKNGIIPKRESDNERESKFSLSPPLGEFSKDSRFPLSDDFSYKKSSKKYDDRKLPKFLKFPKGI